MNMRMFVPAILSIALVTVGVASGETIVVSSARDLSPKTAQLSAGDTLLVQPGMYDVSTWNIRDLTGTSAEWIVIRAQGSVAVRSNSACCNLVEIKNVHYMRFEGFELTMAQQNDGIDGIKISDYSTYLHLDSLYIHRMTNNGISVFPDSADNIILTNSEIANNGGSGLYWGYPGRDIVHDVMIHGNYIHDCPKDPQKQTHYGIQLKGWSYRATITDNVLHDVGGTTRSGLIVYYGRKPLCGDDDGDVNIVRGNVVFNARNEGITVMSDAVVENNVVFDAHIGINIQTYSDESFSGGNCVENLTVRNNTVYRCDDRCIAVSGWGSAGNDVVLSGNVAVQPSAGAFSVRSSGPLGSAIVTGNVHYGISNLGVGMIVAKGLSDFESVSAGGAVPHLDFRPAAQSAFLDVESLSSGPGTDFDGTPSPAGSSFDAGAYERTGGEAAWMIKEGFKASNGSAANATKRKPQRQGFRGKGEQKARYCFIDAKGGLQGSVVRLWHGTCSVKVFDLHGRILKMKGLDEMSSQVVGVVSLNTQQSGGKRVW